MTLWDSEKPTPAELRNGIFASQMLAAVLFLIIVLVVVGIYDRLDTLEQAVLGPVSDR